MYTCNIVLFVESLTAEIQRLMESIGLCKTENQQEEKKESEQLLDEVTFDGIAKYIQSDKCKNVRLTYFLYLLVHFSQSNLLLIC